MHDSSHIRVKGTLILITLFQEGLIIAADMGGGYGDVFLSDQEKVFKIAPQFFFAVAGNARIVLRTDLSQDVFNVASIVKEFFGNLVSEGDKDFWKDLEDRLLMDFSAYLSSLRFEHWPNHEEHSSKVFYKIVFVYVGDGERIGLTELSFRYVKKNPPDISIETIHGRFEGLYLAYGYTHIAYGLRTEKPELRVLSSHPSISPFLDISASPNGITFDQALTFVRLIMAASNEMNPSAYHVTKQFSYAALKGKLR